MGGQNDVIKAVYAAQPREGTETRRRRRHPCRTYPGLCSSTPRGDGNLGAISHIMSPSLRRFMQLNPARGRKQVINITYRVFVCYAVYAAQPREGTETFIMTPPRRETRPEGLCSSTPRGDGNVVPLGDLASAIIQRGLCSSTPRGDGNPSRARDSPTSHLPRFMQLNPARGRKHAQ